MFGCELDDPRIEEMEPMRRMWMFYNWLADQTDDVELAKNHAYLLGSFWNPEAVQKLLGEGGKTHKSTDAEFEKTTQLMEKEIQAQTQKSGRKKKKRKIKG